MEKALSIFIGKTVSIANGSWNGDKYHWREIKLSRYPYTFINWVYDTLFGWIFGKRKDLNVNSLGNFPTHIVTIDKPLFDSFSGKIVGKVRLVGADLQLNKDINFLENVPGIEMGDREEVENLRKQNDLLNMQFITLTEKLQENVNDVAFKNVLKMAEDMQKVRNKMYSVNDFMKRE